MLDVVRSEIVHSIIKKNLRGLEKIGDSNRYQAVQNIQDQMVWQRRQKTAKNLLNKAKVYNKDPYLAILEARNTPVDNNKFPAELACERQLRSILPIDSKIS